MDTVRKVAVYPCGGVGFVLSSISRYAAYQVTEDMLPGQTEIVDVLRLISGIQEEVALVEDNPTVIIDGCGYQCGSNLFRLLGLKPAARVLIPPIAKLPATFVCDCKKQETKLAPGMQRRVPSESGKNLATEIATRVKNIALVILNMDYPYQKQTVSQDENVICDYLENIPQAVDYVAISEGIDRPGTMPGLAGLE